MKLVYHADKIYEDDLKPCPLCGKPVKMRGEGKAFKAGPGIDTPVFNVHYLIKCKDCQIKLDLAGKGFIGFENKSDEECEQLLLGVLNWQAEKVRKIWNRRVNDLHN